jgi:hypothetical protein
LSGWSDWRWHWNRSGIWIQAGIEGELLSSLSEEDAHASGGGASIREFNLGVPFGDSGSLSQVQIGVFPVRPGEEPDLFGNYVARYEPYPREISRYRRASDSLGSTGNPGTGLRAALGRAGDPLRSEFLALWELGDVSFFGYLDGTLPHGFDWSLGVGWWHALAGENFRWYEDQLVWAKTDSGYLPIDYARNAGLAYSDSGGITPRGWAASARLQWIGSAEAMGRYGAFGEAALLGIENQPLFYEDRWRRGAATVGAYLPTGGWLQVCLVQAEWRPVGYHLNDALRAQSAERYGFSRGDSASVWSYAALLGRDFGRHWALRGRIAYAPREWTYWMNGSYYQGYGPVSPALNRGGQEFTFQFRAVFRFGRRT